MDGNCGERQKKFHTKKTPFLRTNDFFFLSRVKFNVNGALIDKIL